jgi:endonuclease/exonuclease/phosphatase (EEP) superfamily protein YafD
VAVGGVVTIGWALSVASLAALFGAAWWLLDLVANFRPLIATALLVPLGVVLGLRPLRRPAAVVFAVAALANVAVMWPYLVATAPRASAGEALEVVSYNVGISSPERDEAMRWVGDQTPDLVFLYESSFEWEDSIMRVGLPLEIVASVPAGRLAGITVLARPELNARPVDTPFDPSQGLGVAVDLGGRSIEVVGLHPPSPINPGRAGRRDALLAAAGDWVANRTSPVLVVGDLNATPWSHAFRSLLRRGSLSDSLRGRGMQPSWPAGWGPLMIPIDHALSTEGLVVTERATGPDLGSTHVPLRVTVLYEDEV